MKRKKCLRPFNEKNTFIRTRTRLKTKKLLASAKQLFWKSFVFCLKKRQFFSQSERTDRLDPHPPTHFLSLFKDPPSPFRMMNVLFECLIADFEYVFAHRFFIYSTTSFSVSIEWKEFRLRRVHVNFFCCKRRP